MRPRITGVCVLCNWRRHVSDLAIVRDTRGKHEVCHGAWDESPTCYERFGAMEENRGSAYDEVVRISEELGMYDDG